LVARMAGEGKRQKRYARQTGKLHVYRLLLRSEERARNPLLSHALPEVRRADGPQIRKRRMTKTP
jgi:hypothetical protein